MRIFDAKFRFRFASMISFPESEINLPEKYANNLVFVRLRVIIITMKYEYFYARVEILNEDVASDNDDESTSVS